MSPRLKTLALALGTLLVSPAAALAQEEGGGGGHAAEEEGGSFLVEPGAGLMVWTLIVFLVSMFVLSKLAFPRIAEALDRRQKAIEESIDHAERIKTEADQLLADYRERLQEARKQADEIVERARNAAATTEKEAQTAGQAKRAEALEQARKDIEAETQRALQEIRKEVAGLTLAATEKVTRKSLTDDDQKRLIEEALSDLDFSSLSSRN